MLFTEFHFIFIFLPVTLLCFELAKTTNHKLSILILFSLLFYTGWNVNFLPLLLFSVVVNFYIGEILKFRKSRLVFILGIAINLIPIFYFKYSGLIAETFGLPTKTGVFNENLGSLLPLGISFYTFQQIAYLADVYTNKLKPDGFIKYSFFVTFFPQLIAGPIVHYNQIIPQVGKSDERTRRFIEGILYFSIGLFKKLIIADSFADYSDSIFNHEQEINTEKALMASLGYTFQLYFDFSGYSDMALGLARLFGWKLPINFESPYRATSIIEFWRRWHITLSRFLKDYIYISFGGNKLGETLKYRNILFTMLIGGLWHGAAWTFVAWGGLHGLALIVNHLWKKYGTFSLGKFGWFLTFSFVVLLWVLFRAESFDDAIKIYSGLINFSGFSNGKFWLWCLVGISIIFLPNSHAIVNYCSEKTKNKLTIDVPSVIRRLGYYSIISSVMISLSVYAYYITNIDRWVYSKYSSNRHFGTITNKTGDLRNNLWSSNIFSEDARRIAIVGSSFTSLISGFNFEIEGKKWSSESLGMGGNGLFNGARMSIALSKSKTTDIIVLGISPLNFGNSIDNGAFYGQCSSDIANLHPRFGEKDFSSCGARKLSKSQIMKLNTAAFRQTEQSYQYHNFITNLAMLFQNNNFRTNKHILMNRDEVQKNLNSIAEYIKKVEISSKQVPNKENGNNKKFKWFKRGIFESLKKGGKSYKLLSIIKNIADKNGVRLYVYETPTVKHEIENNIYPDGFYEQYQVAVRTALQENGIPYLDLSDLLPWRGDTMRDFVHSDVRNARNKIHKILLYWIFHTDLVENSGLLDKKHFNE